MASICTQHQEKALCSYYFLMQYIYFSFNIKINFKKSFLSTQEMHSTYKARWVWRQRWRNKTQPHRQQAVGSVDDPCPTPHPEPLSCVSVNEGRRSKAQHMNIHSEKFWKKHRRDHGTIGKCDCQKTHLSLKNWQFSVQLHQV